MKGFHLLTVLNRPLPSYLDDVASLAPNQLGRLLFAPNADFSLSAAVTAGIAWWHDELQKHRIMLVLCCSYSPVGPGAPFWTDVALQDKWVKMWADIAAKYPDICYDLLNEPIVSNDIVPSQSIKWVRISQSAIDAIRKVSNGVIMYEPTPGGMASGFGECVLPPPTDGELLFSPPGKFLFAPPVGTNLMASLHFYEPYNLTHWGVYAHFPQDPTIFYPDPVRDPKGLSGYTKAGIKHKFDWVQAWSVHFKMPIYVGEFSCVHWAPKGSRDLWLADVLELIDSYGWSWTYLAWRNWQGWSPELDSPTIDPLINTGAPTPSLNVPNAYSKAMQLLRKHLVK